MALSYKMTLSKGQGYLFMFVNQHNSVMIKVLWQMREDWVQKVTSEANLIQPPTPCWIIST